MANHMFVDVIAEATHKVDELAAADALANHSFAAVDLHAQGSWKTHRCCL